MSEEEKLLKEFREQESKIKERIEEEKKDPAQLTLIEEGGMFKLITGIKGIPRSLKKILKSAAEKISRQQFLKLFDKAKQAIKTLKPSDKKKIKKKKSFDPLELVSAFELLKDPLKGLGIISALIVMSIITFMIVNKSFLTG